MSATVSGPTAHDDAQVLRELSETDPLAVMRACHDRRLEREGIPMILGLADERGTVPEGTAAQRAEGARLVEVLDRYRDALVPWARDDDEGALITTMQVLGVTRLTPETHPIVEEVASELPDGARDARTSEAAGA